MGAAIIQFGLTIFKVVFIISALAIIYKSLLIVSNRNKEIEEKGADF